MTDRRSSLVSQKSTSPEAPVILPPSPISSEEPLSNPSSKSSSKPLSNVSAAIHLLKDRRKCLLEENWNPIQLQPGDYDELWLQLKREEGDLLIYIEDKVHLDYDPETFELVVRMPTSIHESIGGSVAYDIRQQVDTISSGNNSAAVLAQKIACLESASVFLEDGARHDPDKQFAYKGARYPSVIIEIAYSQGRKNLSRLADHYIVESSGQVQTVIGIELEYKGSKTATVSTWCPKYGVDNEGRFLASEEVLSEEFRKADGTGVTDKALRLQLRHFVPSQIEADPNGLAQEILIPYEKLAIFVDRAEDIQGTETIPHMLSPRVRKRRRKSSSPEELTSGDEKVYQRLETTKARRVEQQDGEWVEN